MDKEPRERLSSTNSWKLLAVAALLSLAGVGVIWSGFQNESLSRFFSNENQTPSQIQSPVIVPSQESSLSQSLGVTGQQAQINRVIDGDTIEVSLDGELKKVRLIGVDTPETVDPRRPVGCFGKEAASKTKQLVEGKKVILVKDISETDKFDRLLRYVYVQTDDGEEIFVNDYLVREGFAKAVTFPPDVKFAQQFQEAERQARLSNKGLWGKCQGV